MRKHLGKRILGIAMSTVILTAVAGCSDQTTLQGSVNLMQGMKNEQKRGLEEKIATDGTFAVTDLGLRLLRESYRQGEGKNVLLSPLSVIYALAMTANGARGNTLAQMEEVFGMSVPELNVYLSDYMQALSVGKEYKLSMANAIWFKDSEDFVVEQDFLQANADFFDAGLYKAPFDNSTLNDINGWVKDNTDGMIDKILNQISDEDIMYLVNALAFDAQWETIYMDIQVSDGTFTREDGKTQNVKMMYSSEYSYLETEQAEGFLKYYVDRKYAFAALLPKEGVTVEMLLDSLTAQDLNGILSEPVNVEVYTAIPKYKSGYSIGMNEILQEMGIQDAFDVDRADFTGISQEGELFINQVLHMTFIAVDERGTRAGAVTAVQMNGGAAPVQEEVKTVHLDRPFVYMIVDCESNLPVFMGTVMEIIE